MKLKSFFIVASSSALLLGAGCMNLSGTPASPASPSSTNASSTSIVPQRVSVTVKDSAFEPNSITVKVGTVVVWTNTDNMLHTITSDDMAFDSEPLATGMTYSFTFAKPGTYPYHCKVHPSMKGTVIVQ